MNKNSFGRTMEFYTIIQQRVGAYEALVIALTKLNQTGAVTILEQLRRPTAVTTVVPTELRATPDIPKNDDAGTDTIDTNNPADEVMDAMDAVEVDFRNSFRPLEVAVRKPMSRMTFPDDQYRLPVGFKGYALILNITEFDDSRRARAGAKYDTEYMTNLWKQLDYQVITHDAGYYSYQQVDDILNEFKSKFTSLPPGSPVSCVIFIGSHGRFSSIETSDSREINLYRDVIYKFDAKNCPQLQGKPKIFLIQACQRFEYDDATVKPPLDRREVDSTLPTPIDDAIVCFSTIPGYVANRDMYLGTWYIYCFAKVVMENAYRMDFLRMLKKV